MEPIHYNVPYKSSTCWSAANGLDSCWTPCGRMSWYRWCFRWCCLWCGSAKWQQDFVGVVVVLNDFSTRKVKLEREREGGKVNFIVGLPPVLAFHPSGTRWIVNLSCFRIFQLFRLKYTNSDPDNHKKTMAFRTIGRFTATKVDEMLRWREASEYCDFCCVLLTSNWKVADIFCVLNFDSWRTVKRVCVSDRWIGQATPSFR